MIVVAVMIIGRLLVDRRLIRRVVRLRLGVVGLGLGVVERAIGGRASARAILGCRLRPGWRRSGSSTGSVPRLVRGIGADVRGVGAVAIGGGTGAGVGAAFTDASANGAAGAAFDAGRYFDAIDGFGAGNGGKAFDAGCACDAGDARCTSDATGETRCAAIVGAVPMGADDATAFGGAAGFVGSGGGVGAGADCCGCGAVVDECCGCETGVVDDCCGCGAGADDDCCGETDGCTAGVIRCGIIVGAVGAAVGITT
jgi:hypothetical protein